LKKKTILYKIRGRLVEDAKIEADGSITLLAECPWSTCTHGVRDTSIFKIVCRGASFLIVSEAKLGAVVYAMGLGTSELVAATGNCQEHYVIEAFHTAVAEEKL
jgi:hypothetical protein